MQIQHIQHQPAQPNFQNKFIKKIMQQVPNTKTAKGLTTLDAAAMEGYINLRPYRMNITQEELSSLKKFEGLDFIFQSYLFLCKKLGFTENIRPQLQVIEQMENAGKMMYAPLNNIIFCDASKIKDASKDQLFAFLRHELQHYAQNAAILRHETIGKEAIETMTQNYIKQEVASIIKLLQTHSDDELSLLVEGNPAVMEYFRQCKLALETGNQEQLNKLIEASAIQYKNQILAIQQEIKKQLGEIPENSPLTNKIKEDFEALLKPKYYNEDGSIDYKKYFTAKIEKEATDAQNAALIAFQPKECGAKLLKESILNSFKKDFEILQKTFGNEIPKS